MPNSEKSGGFGLSQIRAAHDRIHSHIHRTPVLTSATLDALSPGKQIFFKCECFQKTGSFKARGAMNAVTHSSGNHGQALAWAARQNSLECAVVAPDNTPAVKLDAIRAYGAKLVSCEANMAARWKTCAKIATQLGYLTVDPHNDFDVIAGQGTIAVELLEQVPNLDAIIVSVGGGGLAAGIASFVKAVDPRIRVYCAEVEGKNLQRQLETGKHECSEGLAKTMADGVRVIQIGPNGFGLLLEHAEKTVFTLSEAQIHSATQLLWQRLKVVAEPAAALPLAAVLSEEGKEALKDCTRIGLILCGGNFMPAF